MWFGCYCWDCWFCFIEKLKNVCGGIKKVILLMFFGIGNEIVKRKLYD